MKYKYFRNKSSGIDMTPLMDIIFLVLIFFMVGATFEMNRALNMNLPDSFSSEGNISERKVIIEIDQYGNTAVNGNKCDFHELSDAIISSTTGIDYEVFIMGDQLVPYKNIIDIMDLLKILGFDRISLVTDMKKEL